MSHILPLTGVYMLKKISHIGIAVKSLDEAIPFYQNNLGMVFQGIEEVTEQQVKVAFFRMGESKIELLEPTSADSPVAGFLEKNGPGIHHIAYEVDDIVAAIAKLVADGARMIDKVPRQGAHGALIAFLHPKSSHGVLTELCQLVH
jgi:methylmalonyl-CoA/ethylmalonyl-CoA epimerase